MRSDGMRRSAPKKEDPANTAGEHNSNRRFYLVWKIEIIIDPGKRRSIFQHTNS